MAIRLNRSSEEKMIELPVDTGSLIEYQSNELAGFFELIVKAKFIQGNCLFVLKRNRTQPTVLYQGSWQGRGQSGLSESRFSSTLERSLSRRVLSQRFQEALEKFLTTNIEVFFCNETK